MKITHLQANALFELSTRFGVNLFALYPKLKKKKGSVILILEYDCRLVNGTMMLKKIEIDKNGNIIEGKAKIKKKGV